MNEAALLFRRRGFVVLDVFTAAEAADYRDEIMALSECGDADESVRWGLQHGVSRTPALWSLIGHPRLLDAVRRVLDATDLRYAEHSDLKVWRRRPASGWHRDSIADRPAMGPEWSDSYRVVRVACYFQGPDHGFMWGAVPGSHLAEQALRPWERAFWQRFQAAPAVDIGSRLAHLPATPQGRPWIRAGTRLRAWHAPVAPSWIPTAPTKCVLFDPRLIHAGGPVRHTKVAAFLAFGRDDEHTRRHRLHFLGGDSPHDDDLTRRLSELGLALT